MEKQKAIYHVHVKFDTEILGTAPADPDVYTDFIVSKKFAAAKALDKKGMLSQETKKAIAEEKDELTREEIEALPEDAEKGITVFRRHPLNKSLVLPDYMWRGFLKAASQSTGDANGKTWGMAGKIDRFVFITDASGRPMRWVPLLRDGAEITEPDGTFSRPLRAETQQGPRVTLAKSELLEAGIESDFYITVLPLGFEKAQLGIETLTKWLEFGMYSGCGQFRNGGYGRFTATIEPITE